MIWITEKDGSNLRRLNITSCTHTEAINGEQTLDLKTSDPIKKYDLVIFKNSLNEWNEFVVRGTDQDRNGTTAYLEHSSYELHDFIIREKRPENKSAEFILGEILNGTRWSVGTSEITGSYTLNMYYITAYEAIKKLVELTGCELEFKFTIDENNNIVSRTINLKVSLGEDRGRIFTYSKDMYGVRRTINEDVITALIGRGKGEQISENGWGRRIRLTDLDMPDSPLGADYVEDVAARDIFGIYNNGTYLHRFGTIEFDDIEDINELYLETKKVLALNSVPRITYEVDVAILNTVESRVALGDVIHIFDSDFNGEVLKLHGRVQKIKHDLLFPENTEVVIGNILSNMAYFQKKVDAQLNSMRSKVSVWDRANAFNNNNQLPASYIQNLLEEWNTLANLSGGYTYTIDGEGTITYDQPFDANPTRAVQIVGGTIRIANSKTIEGEWLWKTVINADGIAGEQILANSITTNKLSSDFAENLDLSSNQSINLKVEALTNEIDAIELTPGPPTYTWIRYADDINGGGISNDPTGKSYIGLAYNKLTATESNTPSDYTWALIKGDTGVKGDTGASGQTFYTWIKYSDNADGTGLYDVPTVNTQYIGIAVNKTTPTESNNKVDYTWSKFKGDTGPKGDTGDQGKGIISTTITYQAGSSGTTAPTGTWLTSVPTVSENQFLWTRTIITYTDNQTTTAYSVGKMGAQGPKGDTGQAGSDGKGITLTTVTYQAGTSGTTAPTGTWSATVPNVAENQYLWTRIVIKYTDNSEVTSYSVGKMGAQGPQGAKGDKGDTGPQGATGTQGPKGDTGTSVVSVVEYYLATNLSSGVTTSTTGWTTTMQSMTTTNKYLWNYEIINFSDGSSSPTIPVIIGVYGNTGGTGRSLTSVTEYYLASASASGVTRATSGWTTAMQTTSPALPYLWNYEKLTWSVAPNETFIEPIIIGVHGAQGPQGPQGIQGPQGPTGQQGKGISSTVVTYQASSSGTVAPTGTWSGTIPTVAENQYLWTRTVITYTDSQTTTAYSVGKMGAQGPQGNTGATGNGISSTTVTYQAGASGTTAPTGTWSTTVPAVLDNQYLWTRVVISYTGGGSTTSYSVGKMGAQGPQGAKGDKGDTGPQGATGTQGPKGDTGVGVSSVTEYYLATSAATGVTTATAGWTTTMQSMTTTNKYLWNYEVISFSDGSSSPTIPVIIGVYGNTGNTGATGRSLTTVTEYYLASASSSGVTRSTSGWTTTIQTTTPSLPYLWNYEKLDWSAAPATTYIEPIIIGIHGAQGQQGPQGIQGPQGPQGQATYTWIKYADTPTTGMSDLPDGKKYMGIAYNKTTATESSTYADYAWSLIQGPQGNQGIQGPAGTNGQPTYTWVKYADTVTGTGMSDSPTGKRFLGLAHNKTTATESSTAADYQWSPLYDNVQVGSRNLLRSAEIKYNYGTLTDSTTEKISGSGKWFVHFPVNLVPGQQYTVSNKSITNTSTVRPNNLNIALYNSAINVARGTVGVFNSGESKTFTAPSTMVDGDNILFYVSDGTIQSEFEIQGLKLEKGNIATDWTPAPEDTDERITNVESEIQLTKDFFSLTFTKQVSEIKNKLVYADTVHVYGAEQGVKTSNINIFQVDVPLLNIGRANIYTPETPGIDQGLLTYHFTKPSEISMYGLKKGVPYTFSASILTENGTPSTAVPASPLFRIYYYNSSSQLVQITSKSWAGINTYQSDAITFTIPTNAIGFHISVEIDYSLDSAVNQLYTSAYINNLQLEEGSSATSFSNNVSTISGARYVFNGDNASFYNGGLRIFNKNNTQVFGADTEGDLWVASLKIAGGDAWHAGNFNPSNYSLTNHLHEAIRFADTRSAVDVPSDKLSRYLSLDFKFNTSVGNPPVNASTSFSHIITVAGWNTGESSGGWPTQLSVGDGMAFRRAASATTWGSWQSFWHTGNFNPANYLALSGGNLTGLVMGQYGTGVIAQASRGTPSFEAVASGANASYITFHRESNYAVRFGLDTDNKLKVGGWSMGAVSYEILHSGNFSSYASPASHTHATLTNGVGIVGYPYDGSTARSWYVGAGTGISVGSTTVAITSIASGSGTVGALRYNGTSRLDACLYGGSTVPSGTKNLNYDGIFWAQGLRYGASGNSSYSDIRMKKDVGSLNYAEQLILSLKPKQFRFKEEFEPPEEVLPSKANAEIPTSRTSNRQQLHYGFIAQDVEKIVDELGINRPAFLKEPDQDNEYYGINYTELIAPMIDVIQKQQKRIDDIERLLERLA